MQFDRFRAFPYPVLRPFSQDYVDGEFQATVEYEVGEADEPIVAHVLCHLSVPELRALIDSEKAEYVAVFSCRGTFYREVQSNRNPKFTVTFSPGSLRGEVSFEPYVVARTHIEGFSSALIHQEWGQARVDFWPGAVLAMDAPSIVFLDRDVFRPVSSVFVLVKSENITGDEWRIDIEDDKVRIELSPANKEIVDRVRNSEANKAVLLNSIYLSAVTHCVCALKADDTYWDRRWARVLLQNAEIEGVDLQDEPEYVVAQRLLRRPLSLLKTYQFSEERS